MKHDLLSKRLIALTDLETTGDIPGKHEILEIGLVLFDPTTFEIVDTMDVKVKPSHIETALPVALQVNGYNEKDWENAITLEEAVGIYAEKTKGAVFCSFNVTFDWGFIRDAFTQTKTEDQMDYHRIDVLTMAWTKGMKKEDSWSLKNTCKFFGVTPEPEPHTAFAGAKTAYEVFKKINS